MAGNSGGGVAPLLRQPLFVASAGIYAAYQLATRAGHWVPPDWAGRWLADLLCMPVVLTVALAAQRGGRRLPTFTLPDAWLVLAWAFVSVWFEVLAPRWVPARYTADWFDVVAYGLGTWGYRQWLNRTAPPEQV